MPFITGILMHMTKQDQLYILVPCQDIFQSFGIFKPVLVNPVRFHRKRVMMTSDDDMLMLKLKQSLVQLIKLSLFHPAINLALNRTIQQNHDPATKMNRMYLIGILMKRKDPGVIMITWNLIMRHV